MFNGIFSSCVMNEGSVLENITAVDPGTTSSSWHDQFFLAFDTYLAIWHLIQLLFQFEIHMDMDMGARKRRLRNSLP